MEEAATASASIAKEISGVNTASRDVNAAAAAVNAQAEELSNLSANLKGMVEQFSFKQQN